MASPVFSTKFLSVQGLNGSSPTIIVPPGHTYIVKQLSSYGSSSAVDINVFFVDLTSGAATWRHNIPGGTSNWGGDYGARVFEEGDSFGFNVAAAPIDTADVYAAGYDLTN